MADTSQRDIAALVTESVAHHSTLMHGLSQTAFAPPQLAEQNRLASDLQSQLVASDSKLQRLGHQRRIDLRELQSARESPVKRLMYKAAGKSGKYAERVEEEQKHYLEILQQEQEEYKTNANLRAQLQVVEDKRRPLEVPAERHRMLQNQLDDLYQSIFGGPTPEFPHEDEKERASEAKLQQYHKVLTQMEGEVTALELLNKAAATLEKALDHMITALSDSKNGVGGFSGITTGRAERDDLVRGSAQLDEAKELIRQAQTFSSSVEAPRPVHVTPAAELRQMLRDRALTEVDLHYEIRGVVTQTEQCIDAVKDEAQKSRERQVEIKGTLEERAGELEEARKELQDIRTEIFEGVAEGRIEGERLQGQEG